MDIQFRQAAGEGNIDLMRQLVSSVDPMEADPSSKKSRYSVEWVQVEENNNHAFIILNGSLVIDLFYRKSFFCAHQDIELKSSSVKNPPESLWPQERSVALYNKLHSRLEEDCKKLLNSF